MLAQASAIRYSPVMILNPEIERIFETTPILAEIPRSRWQVTPLGGLTNQTYRLRADDRDLAHDGESGTPRSAASTRAAGPGPGLDIVPG